MKIEKYKNSVHHNSMVLLAQMISYATHMGLLILVAKVIYVGTHHCELSFGMLLLLTVHALLLVTLPLCVKCWSYMIIKRV